MYVEMMPGASLTHLIFMSIDRIGGSSSVNRMLHGRGHPIDFNKLWNTPSWAWEDAAPYYTKIGWA